MRKLIFFTLFLILLGVLVLYFLFSKGVEISSPFGNPPNKEKFVENPLNGVLFPESEKEKILGRRPLAVQIGNNVDARPPSGLSQADLVYEVVAEGGITRFQAYFLSNDPEKIGPVRSIRSYFLYWVLENGDAMVMHDGWSTSVVKAASAFDLIVDLDIRSLFKGGLYGYRDSLRFAPNNEYISAITARTHAEKLGWLGVGDFEKWQFKNDDEKIYNESVGASEVNVIFWTSGDYDSKWSYDPEKNVYLKSTGGGIHKDLENGVQLAAKNVIVQFVKETSVNDEKNHLLYETIGSGNALIFLDGKKVESVWRKQNTKSRTRFFDTNGNEIKFNRGVVWVEVVPDRNVSQVTTK